MTARSSSGPASSPLSASAGTARPASLSALPAISPRASTRAIWRAWAPGGSRGHREGKGWGLTLFGIQKRRDPFAGFLARHDRDDPKAHAEPLAVQDPFLQQPRVVAFHQLKAAVEIGLDPATDIGQSFRKFYPGIADALVDRDRVAVFETLDHHEEHRQPP